MDWTESHSDSFSPGMMKALRDKHGVLQSQWWVRPSQYSGAFFFFVNLFQNKWHFNLYARCFFSMWKTSVLSFSFFLFFCLFEITSTPYNSFKAWSFPFGERFLVVKIKTPNHSNSVWKYINYCSYQSFFFKWIFRKLHIFTNKLYLQII